MASQATDDRMQDARSTALLSDRVRTGLLAQVSAASGASREIRSPWNGDVIGEVPTHTLDELDGITRTARDAQRAWAAVPMSRRRAIVRRFARLVLDRRDTVLDVIQAETGKSRVHALEETLDVALLAGHYAGTAGRALRPRIRLGAIPMLTSVREVRHPKGVVGVISPWNYPFTLAASDAIPALLAGNAVVLKPDSQTPYSALLALSLLREAGLPRDVMQVVLGPGATIGDALIDAVDFMMFTGSTATGTAIAQRCASRLIGFSAELGGKNPLVVLEDADLAAAARGAARACFSNAGQLCISVERIYVPERIADAFTEAFVAETRALRIGTGADWGIDVGSLISDAQLRTVQAHVDDAVERGARVLTGGGARPDLGDLVFEPTILTDVPETALLHRDETFGPVVSIYRTPDEETAIARANDSDYGLNASLWTRRADATEVAAALRTGTVNINEGYAAAWASHAAPMGGWKASGVGRRHGREGIEKYTEVQTIARQRLRPVGPWPGMSNAAYERLMVGAARALNLLR
ncbi:succinic semialdehyde dehydrogenase [Microbacterium rhizophilus]|uniref:succinic semialdehyde dehydrogenase n=1 Tax=Microbacterium rhizophilus TaxID=3138934 RepID=UPI0031E9EEC1